MFYNIFSSYLEERVETGQKEFNNIHGAENKITAFLCDLTEVADLNLPDSWVPRVS